MSALAGWATSAGEAPAAAALAGMLEALAHRSSGEPSVLLERKSRRTLVMAAPLGDAAAGISVAVDGTLLNAAELRAELERRGYRFSGSSSEELALRAYQQWDKDFVRHLRGAFALSLWDARRERLLLARDHFGQKPLYLATAGSTLAFASEAKALARCPFLKVEVDVEAVGEYLACGYVRGPRTLLKGIRKLAPGTCATWQFGNLREVRYWTPPDGEPRREARHDEPPVEGFLSRLDAAVKLHLAGDEPTGVLLSGGYDSAAIVALAKRHAGELDTFAAGFAEDKASELGQAARVAQHFGTRHHEIVLSRRDLLACLPQAVASRDAPFARPADVALHLLARQAARNVKVALSGDGGDEILGGYRRHTVLRPFAGSGARLGAGQPAGLFVVPVADPVVPAGGSLREILYYEQMHWLPDNLLERTERMTLSAALEVRAPFVDPRLAEYVSQLPDTARVRGLTTKWILRKADEKLLERAFKPRKGGFRIALGDLMRAEMRDLVADHLRGPSSATRAYCEPRALDRLLDEHLSVKKNHERMLWTLLNLEIWHRTLSASPPRG